VQVALQQIAKGRPVAAGSVIEYVICETTAAQQPASTADGAPAAPAVVGKSIAERARHPSAVLASAGSLAIDREWYLANQIHPPVARLVEVIEGTDSARIAACLGLDPSKFSSGSAQQTGAESAADEIFGNAVEDDETRFRDTQPLLLRCAACGDSTAARPLTATLALPGGKHPALTCGLCGEDYDGVSMHNQLTAAMREAERTYYKVSAAFRRERHARTH
jgi:DNA polymerase alpha subunit A